MLTFSFDKALSLYLAGFFIGHDLMNSFCLFKARINQEYKSFRGLFIIHNNLIADS